MYPRSVSLAVRIAEYMIFVAHCERPAIVAVEKRDEIGHDGGAALATARRRIVCQKAPAPIVLNDDVAAVLFHFYRKEEVIGALSVSNALLNCIFCMYLQEHGGHVRIGRFLWQIESYLKAALPKAQLLYYQVILNDFQFFGQRVIRLSRLSVFVEVVHIFRQPSYDRSCVGVFAIAALHPMQGIIDKMGIEKTG